ncbi:MAG: hypothetical protein HRT99_01890 [Mycoplasmatales bacterium]|nr:hypothetical protein [Mycoplasmatales bacterium]
MSSVTWWILAGTIPVALIIMLIAWLTMKMKIESVKRDYALARPDDISNPALNRDDHGHLLWDLKEKTKNPLADLSMEFVINTILRNKYKTFYIEGFNEGYEEKTIVAKTKAKKTAIGIDLALISFNNDFIDRVDILLKNINDSGMIVLVNAPKDKNGKKLLSYLKLTGVRNEFHKINKGIILIAK